MEILFPYLQVLVILYLTGIHWKSLVSSGLPASLIDSIVTPAASSATPFDLQNGITHSASISYIKTLTDKITLTPSFNFSKMYYNKGSNRDRIDTTYMAQLLVTQSMIGLMSLHWINYTSKDTNGNLTLNLGILSAGLLLQQNYSFRFLMKRAPAHTLWVLFLSSFTFSLGYSSEDLVISLLEKGKEEAEKGTSQHH